MTSPATDEEVQGPVVNGGDWTAAFIKMMNVGSASTIFDMLQKSVDRLFRRSWKNRLPPDYQNILSRAFPHLECKSEAQLKVILYKGILIDQGEKWFSLDKETGKKRYVISARKLAITWSNDKRYYRWISLPESERCKFPEVAELLQVCWLDIAGSIDSRDLSPGTNYGAYLILKFVDGNYGLDVQPAQISVKVGGTVKSGTAYLRPNEKRQLMKKRLQFLYHMQVLLTNSSKYVQQIEDEEDEDMVDEEDEDGVDEEDTEDEDLIDEEDEKDEDILDEEVEEDEDLIDEEDEKDEDTVDEEVEEDEEEEDIVDEEVEEIVDEDVEEIVDEEEKDTVDEENEDNGGGSPKGAANDRADDDWMEIELGTFFIDGDDGMVEINLKETGGHWKSGLVIQSIEVRPVDFNPPK